MENAGRRFAPLLLPSWFAGGQRSSSSEADQRLREAQQEMRQTQAYLEMERMHCMHCVHARIRHVLT